MPDGQHLNKSAKQEISLLCGNIHRDLLVRSIATTALDFKHLRSKEHIQPAARKKYLQLRDAEILVGGNGPRVKFDRHGWRHITRYGRPELTRYQSFVLLGCVQRILESTPLEEFQPFRSPDHPDENFIATRAAVSFSFRQTGIIKVVLKADGPVGSPRYKFHTVYEPRRRRNVLGAREPRSL